MKKASKIKASTSDTPTLFDLGTVATKPKPKVIHPDEIDTISDDIPQRRCQHSTKMTTASGWICRDCFKRWEDAGESWLHARLESLANMKQSFLNRMGEQSPHTIKRYETAIQEIEEEAKTLEELFLSSPVVLPLLHSDTTGEPTGEPIYQWVEEYLKKGHLYFRYCYAPTVITPVKKIHIPGGNTSSPKAQDRRKIIESAIETGKTPAEIVEIIKGFT